MSLWLQHSPEIKRLRLGELGKGSIKYQMLNGHKGYDKKTRMPKRKATQLLVRAISVFGKMSLGSWILKAMRGSVRTAIARNSSLN
jgi:hypothetical protein